MPRSAIPGALAALLLAAPAAAQRLPYLPLDSQWHAPRVAVLPLPVDDRIAPDDFAMDAIAEAPPTPAERAAAATRPGLAGWSQNYRPRPAIWRIGDRDTTIWLFGTVHVLPPGFQWRSPALDRVVARAQSLLVESVEDGPGVDPLLTAPPAGRPPLAPLIKRVNRSHRDKLAQLQATLPPPAAALLDTLPTWVAAVAVSVVRETRSGEIPGPGADDWLEARFRTAHKPVAAIEDGAAVMASANAISDAEQRRMLDAALDAPTPTRAELRAPLHAWARGEVGAGSPIAVDMGAPALSAALLAGRNAAWATSLHARLATPGRVLFAAGAGHFIGPGSVLTMLARRGVKVVRVD